MVLFGVVVVVAVACRGVVGDYTGDRKADLVYRTTADGLWHQIGVTEPVFAGLPNDIAVAGDYDGDGRWEPAVVRGRDWISPKLAGPIHYDPPGLPAGPVPYPSWTQSYGPADGILLVPADYDGDGKTDPAYYSLVDGTWWIMGRDGPVSFGIAPTIDGNLDYDLPVPADYDGDGKADLAVYRPSDGSYRIRPSGGGAERTVVVGPRPGIPAPADYDGDGRADPAVTSMDSSTWYLPGSATPFATFSNPMNADYLTPQPADFTGDGKADASVLRSGGSIEIAGVGLTRGTTTGDVQSTGILPSVLFSIVRLTFYDVCVRRPAIGSPYPGHCPPS